MTFYDAFIDEMDKIALNMKLKSRPKGSALNLTAVKNIGGGGRKVKGQWRGPAGPAVPQGVNLGKAPAGAEGFFQR